MSKYLCFLAALSVASTAGAAPVTGWVTTNGDAGFSGGSEATDSPITTDADADTIAAAFGPITLADGEFITLTGSFSTNVSLVGNQFRFGLFDAANPGTTGDGSGYVGYWAQVPTNAISGSLVSTDGSLTNPFSGGAATEIQGPPSGTPGPLTANQVLDFELTIARDGGSIDITAEAVSQVGAYSAFWSVQDTSASPGSFTYDSVAFLLGGSLNGTEATFANVDVTTGTVPEPSSLALLGLGGLALLRRRRA